MIKEIWEWIPWLEDCYEISNKGVIRSLDRYIRHRSGNMILREWKIRKLKDYWTYLSICFTVDGTSYTFMPSRIMMEVYWKVELTRKQVISYKDWNYKNILLDNLYIENKQDTLAFRVKVASVDNNGKILKKYSSKEEAARDVWVSWEAIHYALTWKSKKSWWFMWKFIK